jgi:hypothetical protein
LLSFDLGKDDEELLTLNPLSWNRKQLHVG